MPFGSLVLNVHSTLDCSIIGQMNKWNKSFSNLSFRKIKSQIIDWTTFLLCFLDKQRQNVLLLLFRIQPSTQPTDQFTVARLSVVFPLWALDLGSPPKPGRRLGSMLFLMEALRDACTLRALPPGDGFVLLFSTCDTTSCRDLFHTC